MQTEATKDTGQRFALPIPASGEVTRADLDALTVGDLVRLRAHNPSTQGDWYEVDQVYPVEVTSLGQVLICFHAHKHGVPNIMTSGELRLRWTHPNGRDVWPGSPRECVIFTSASALQAAE